MANTYESLNTSLGSIDPLDSGYIYDLSGKDTKLKRLTTRTAMSGQRARARIPSKIVLPMPIPAPNDSTTLPMPIPMPNDSTPLLSKDPESDTHMETEFREEVPPQSTTTSSFKNGFFLSGSIIFATLFFGFSIGFSMGYFASEKGYFRRIGIKKVSSLDHNNNMYLKPSMMDDVGRKVMIFIEDFLFHESNNVDEASIAGIGTGRPSSGEKDPLMRFSFQGPPSPKKPLIYLNRLDAYALLMDASPGVSTISQYSSDFFLISSGLDAQINQAYCGTASAVAILNSLRFLKVANGNGVNIPIDPIYDPYPYATQEDVFGECTKEHVISQTGGGPGVDGILTPPFGLNMGQIVELLKCHLNVSSNSGSGWKITKQYVDSTHMTIGKMRFDLKNALVDNNSRVLVNYDRSAVGQAGGGHWSPVGSYSEKEDAFLVLDVAKYKYPPVWIPSERLFDGMATTDDCGLWDYPSGQDALSQEERKAHTPTNYASTLEKLNCQPELRGYIIVTRS